MLPSHLIIDMFHIFGDVIECLPGNNLLEISFYMKVYMYIYSVWQFVIDDCIGIRDVLEIEHNLQLILNTIKGMTLYMMYLVLKIS